MTSQNDTVVSTISRRVGADELDPQVSVTVADGPAPPSSRSARSHVIADRYRLDRVIAEGGMGIVFEGWHLILNQPVAVKIVRKEFLHDAEAIQSFVEEARALAELRGPYVAQVLDAGVQDGMPFIVMELLKGRDLRVVAHESGPMPIEKAARLVRQAGLAAAEAHARGIVHCDLKPENLFLAEDADGEERVKVIDFGICTRPGSSDSPDEGLSDKGSPEYMAPEQLDVGSTVDQRADVWALGVVLYELVTGSRPFVGEGLDELKAAVLFEAPVAMNAHGVTVPERFQRLVNTCLEKSPQQRFADASRLCEALLSFEGTQPPQAQGKPPPSPPPSRRAVPWQLSAVAVAATLLLALAGWWFSEVPQARGSVPGSGALKASPASAAEVTPNQQSRAAGDAATTRETDQRRTATRRHGTKAKRLSTTESSESGTPAPATRAMEEAHAPTPAPRAVRAFPDVAPEALNDATYAISKTGSERGEQQQPFAREFPPSDADGSNDTSVSSQVSSERDSL